MTSKTLGVLFRSDNFYWALLEGKKPNLTLLDKATVLLPKGSTPKDYMGWMVTSVETLIDKLSPTKIVYKLSRGFERTEQIQRIYFGLAAINYAAYRKKVVAVHVDPLSLKSQKMEMGWTNVVSLDDSVKTLFPNTPTPWNASIREAVYIAIRELA